MRFKKHEKDFVALVMKWAGARGYRLHLIFQEPMAFRPFGLLP